MGSIFSMIAFVLISHAGSDSFLGDEAAADVLDFRGFAPFEAGIVNGCS